MVVPPWSPASSLSNEHLVRRSVLEAEAASREAEDDEDTREACEEDQHRRSYGENGECGDDHHRGRRAVQTAKADVHRRSCGRDERAGHFAARTSRGQQVVVK